MENRYRIIVLSKSIYKEIEVSPESNLVKFGTGNSCDIRVRKDLFFEPVELVFSKREGGDWIVTCSDNLYIYVDEVRKLMSVPVRHGTELLLKYQQSGGDALHIQFLIDFDYENKEYDRRYDISALGSVSIGSTPENNIVIGGRYTQNDRVVLKREKDGMTLTVWETSYGVYKNGNPTGKKTKISNGDFFSIGDYSFFYKDGKLFTQNRSELRENGINYVVSTKRGHYPKFHRNSRVITLLDNTKIEVLDPPAIPKKPKNNLFTRLLPSLIMVITSIIVGLGGGYFILISIASAAAGIVTAFIGVREAKKDYKKEFNERITKYKAYIQKKREELNAARTEELAVLRENYISESEEIDKFKRVSFELFDRCKDDEDFLDVRLGLGKVEAKRIVEYKKQERLEIEDDLQKQPEKLSKQYRYIDNAPIVCNFKNAGAVGVIGDERVRFDIMKNIIVDVCARQYHTDVKMFFVANEEHTDRIWWLRMLPNVQNDALGIHNLVCDDLSKTAIFEYLYKELNAREEKKTTVPHMLIFLYDEFEFKTHPVSRFVENAKDLGVTFVFFGNAREDIGLGCSYLIESTGASKANLIDTSDSKKTREFVYQPVSDHDVKAMVRLLAPVYTEEISLESSLTKSISLFELFHIIAVDDISLESLWRESKAYTTMAAPIGISKNETVYLDLHDKAHGPHGLVAGTTGAGKSELLQTYILSMAMLYHPYEVAFLIIDFKGGGMANQFKALPHLLGAITNIDGREIERSLKSIKAELKKRQRLFAEADVNHIDKYIIKFRRGEVSVPLPHLILIVDEFAELKADQPEFMKELISASRIGRSLGVHLILATQKPSGQVDEQIWSNSRFKLCLKVQSQQDSNEVLKSPLAAEIKEPGRAYFQVGNNEIFELFQSAYSGAPEHIDESGRKEFTIFEITKSGRKVPVYEKKKKKGSGNDKTQLEALVQYIRGFCQSNNLRKLPDICLPSLSEVIEFPTDAELKKEEYRIIADLGVYDNPDNQEQNMYSVDLSSGNMIIIGSSQSGKTNLLQTIIRSVTTKYTSEQVNIYILDFASMILKNFESLHHVGGVVTASEDEKLKNLFKMIYSEIRTRKEKLLSIGVSSYSAYLEAGKTDMPLIVLMVDNFTSINELYFNDEDLLIEICREGVSVGISVILANSQTAGISYKYLSYFEMKIALHCIDSGEYSNLLNTHGLQINDISGRGLIEKEHEVLEIQTYQSFEGTKEIERSKEISDYIYNANLRMRSAARPIPYVPNKLNRNDVEDVYKGLNDGNHLTLGLNYNGVEPYIIRWVDHCIIAISGNEKKRLFNGYLKSVFNSEGYLLYILDDYTGEFEDISHNNSVKLYTRELEDSFEFMSDIHSELEKRDALRNVGGVKTIKELPAVIVIIQQKEWAGFVSEKEELKELYTDCIKKYKGLKCCFIFTNHENERVNEFQADDVTKTIIKNQTYLVAEDLQNLKLFDVTLNERREFDKKLDDGEMYVMMNNILSKIRFPMD